MTPKDATDPWPWLSPTQADWRARGNHPIRTFLQYRLLTTPRRPAEARVLEALHHVDVMADATRLAWYHWAARQRSSGTTWQKIARQLSHNDSPPWTPQDAHQAFRRPPKRIRAEAQALLDGPHRYAFLDLLVELFDDVGMPGTIRLLTWEKEALIIEARARGCGWQAIAASLACSRQYAHHTYRNYTVENRLLYADGDPELILPPTFDDDEDEEDDEEWEEEHEAERRAHMAAAVLNRTPAKHPRSAPHH
ncbi:hypothetical protein ACFY00_38030 [Kitasatospora sp. NPDC001540]|uniref:hypothetical protein n=1 Tax=Kitasatospora sp. NPDC001540 TaxID=3364014 RepID=UPI0036ACAE2D